MLLQFIHVSCNIATREDSTENSWMQSFDTPIEYFGKLREGGNQFYLNASRSQGVSGAAGREYSYTALLQLMCQLEDAITVGSADNCSHTLSFLCS